MEPENEIDPEFAAAFNADDPAAAEAAEGAVAGQDAPAEEVAEGRQQEANGGAPEAASEQATEQPAAGATLTPEQVAAETQRLRSWEGRIKAREAELAKTGKAAPEDSAAEEASDSLEKVAGAAAAEGSDELAQAANAAAEAVESGQVTAEQAMAQLSEDFGEEFIGMIRVLAKAFAKEEVEPVAKRAQELDNRFATREERDHFGAIGSKHPDYQTVGGSDAFKEFVQSLPPDLRAEAERVTKGGTADEVIELLDVFKEASAKSKPKTDGSAQPAKTDTAPPEDPDLQSMEGVRSGGVRLPERPQAAQDDFEGAWNTF